VSILLFGTKAQEMGYHPEIILAGRRLNDSMGNMSLQIVKLMKKAFQSMEPRCDAGITFKENYPDVRNTKIVDVMRLEMITVSP
jgi:UDP-N-acetyl-D-galactosamine dehydrogenase